MMTWVLLGVLLTVSGCTASVSISCRNEQGEDVDWYILYKQPSIDGENGLKYLYMDESTQGWVEGQYTINDEKSAVGQTLKPLFAYHGTESDSFGYILYNDQPPVPYRTASSSYGHSKGVVLLDKNTGIWLSHSTPDFPGVDIKAFWPDSGHYNGQTFICGTYKYSAFKDIAIQLQYIHVYSFDSHIPSSFDPELQCVAHKKCYPKEAPWYRQLTMTTLAGKTFVSYAKYSKLHDDLYSGVLDKYLGGAFYAKSWGRLRHPLPSNCSVKYDVYNVATMQLPTTEPFSVTVDHSKWTVMVDMTEKPWTCIADMNREVSQEYRGGGAVCTDNTDVWQAFWGVVSTYELCN
ncbi:deoxyribonuclease-2-alpha-like [Engraulis encrasicolus]|uniref:deoxyribonuclease-2-alpha-like n=1 Tax=Engraulis encrasicolus TaxID=184585 RepID=UPI002FD6D352